MKKIILSAEEHLIEKAREKAFRENTTLNQRFKEWLNEYIARDNLSKEYKELMSYLSYAKPGRKFSRKVLNEI